MQPQRFFFFYLCQEMPWQLLKIMLPLSKKHLGLEGLSQTPLLKRGRGTGWPRKRPTSILFFHSGDRTARLKNNSSTKQQAQKNITHRSSKNNPGQLLSHFHYFTFYLYYFPAASYSFFLFFSFYFVFFSSFFPSFHFS